MNDEFIVHRSSLGLFVFPIHHAVIGRAAAATRSVTGLAARAGAAGLSVGRRAQRFGRFVKGFGRFANGVGVRAVERRAHVFDLALHVGFLAGIGFVAEIVDGPFGDINGRVGGVAGFNRFAALAVFRGVRFG